MDITGQHTPAPEGEILLQTDLQSISGVVRDIQGEFRKLNGMGADDNDPVLLRFKLRTLSALQRTIKLVSVSDEASIPEIKQLLNPPKSSKGKNTLSAIGSKLLKRKTRSGDAAQKSMHADRRKKNVTKKLRIHVRQALGAYFAEILVAKTEYQNACTEWYRGNGVLIKQQLQGVKGRKSVRDSGSFPQVLRDLHKTLDCLQQLVEACRRVATGEESMFNEMYADVETHLNVFVKFLREHAGLLSLPNMNMQQLQERDEAKDLAIAEELRKFVEKLKPQV